jgi:hypothetical protein
LVRGLAEESSLGTQKRTRPDEIWITSLFTYWSSDVKNAVDYYRALFPDAKIVVGGIFASLFSKKQVIKTVGCDEVIQGVIPEAEKCFPAYDLLDGLNGCEPLDYQILHASRGCKRHCNFCGTWKIEPKFAPKTTIAGEVVQKKLIFYDNNFLMNPYAEAILEELIVLRARGKISWCESQSGFDGRVLIAKPDLAGKIKESGFRNPRIAWDGKLSDQSKVEQQIHTLTKGGYREKEMFIFMIYNWEVPFEEMEEKRMICWKWGVQISDCRYRPLTQLFDDYNPYNWKQVNTDYYIHHKSGWTDAKVKQFRRNVRQQNICVRQQVPFYSSGLEHKRIEPEQALRVKYIINMSEKIAYLNKLKIDYWFPSDCRNPIDG